jgi:hypothetical protein
MPGIRYGIDGRGDYGVSYAHGMNDCKNHLDICIYTGEKIRRSLENVEWHTQSAIGLMDGKN